MEIHVIAVIIGFLLDLCFGDPYWMPHPVRLMGWLIQTLETIIRKLLYGNHKRECLAGTILAFLVLGITMGFSGSILYLAGMFHPLARLAVESIFCYQLLAAKSLKDESMKVYHALKDGNVERARTAVSMIVGRDTKKLSDVGITKAAVETIAENTSDGVVAPLFYMMLGGAVLGFAYKAVNTMDSMIGYKNDRYLYFGRTAAKLDDFFNLIPARLAALFMIIASFVLGFHGIHAIKIYIRDRYQHKSPNSAHTEAVCAGALDIQLAGDAYYFGILNEKPTIGDDLKPVEYEDIRYANRLLYGTAVAAIVIMTLFRVIFV